MTKQEIYDAARQAKGLPPGADLLDAGLYFRLSELFEKFNAGIMPQAVCTARKAKYYADYDERRQWQEIERETNKRLTKIVVLLEQAKKDGCKHAKDIQDVFCGIG